MVWSCKQNASGKTSKQALLAKAKGEKKTVGRPWTTVDESILHWGSRVELLGTSAKQNDGGDEDCKVWYTNLELLPLQPSRNRGQWKERFFLEVFIGFCFSVVCFVKVAFSQIFDLIYQLLSQLLLIDELQEFQLRGGKTSAFDSIVIRSRNSSWQPTARNYKSSSSILQADLLMFMFYKACTK